MSLAQHSRSSSSRCIRSEGFPPADGTPRNTPLGEDNQPTEKRAADRGPGVASATPNASAGVFNRISEMPRVRAAQRQGCLQEPQYE